MSKVSDTGRRVLVIEDDNDTRDEIVEMLEQMEFTDIVAVATGGAALSAVARHQGGFPVAIVDIFLPDMTAKAMARQLPANHGIETLILLSGVGGDQFAAVGPVFEDLGISDIHYMKKPATVEKFEEILD